MNVLLIAGDRRWQCWALNRSGVTSLLFRALFPCFSALGDGRRLQECGCRAVRAPGRALRGSCDTRPSQGWRAAAAHLAQECWKKTSSRPIHLLPKGAGEGETPSESRADGEELFPLLGCAQKLSLGKSLPSDPSTSFPSHHIHELPFLPLPILCHRTPSFRSSIFPQTSLKLPKSSVDLFIF